MITIPGHPPLVPDQTRLVLEAGPADHDEATATRYIDAAHDLGAWAVKFQMYRHDRLVTADAQRYDQTGGDAQTQRELFADALDFEAWGRVYRYAEAKGVLCFFSVFDLESVMFCSGSLNVPLYKIASGDITYKGLVEAVAKTGKPIVMSTGGSTLEEVRRAVQWVHDVDPRVPLLLLVCTLCYPTHPVDANLSRIRTWRDAGVPVGWSNHVAGWETPVVAAENGAWMVETHFTLTPDGAGDHTFATDETQAAMIQAVFDGAPVGIAPALRAMLEGSPEIRVLDCELAAREGARRSVAAQVDIKEGTALEPGMLTALRPGTGIPAYELDGLYGQRCRQDVRAGVLLDRRYVGRAGARLTVF